MNKIILELNKMYPDPKCMLDYEKDYELVIAVMLSCQSTDKVVNKVTPNLFKYDLFEINALSKEKLEEIIRPVGTFRRKSDYIKKITEEIIKRKSVPNDREFLEHLPGVGRKCANVILAELFNENVIAVDTHISRVSKRLGIADEADDPVIVEEKLMKFFSGEVFSKLHLQLVTFGREICKSKKPLCENCPFYPCKYKKELS